MPGDVRPRQVVHRTGQDAGDVHRNVAVADHHDLLGVEVEACVAMVRMSVEPRDERGRGMASGQIFAGNAEPAVSLGAGREEDLVVMRQHLGEREVRPERDVAEETKAGARRGSLELPGDGLGVLVVRGDAAANEAVRGRQPVEEVDRHDAVGLFQQLLGREEACRPGAEHGNPQRVCRASNRRVAGQALNPGLLSLDDMRNGSEGACSIRGRLAGARF